jgi:UDP-glucuronate 4-epimerase
MARWLVTGAAGFVGFHTCRRLLADGEDVVGIDVVNDYYDPSLKRARLRQLEGERFTFLEADLCQVGVLDPLLAAGPTTVVHLAAQAGVRYSLRAPAEYVANNVVAFGHVLEACRRAEVPHLVYASSSSVYGATNPLPFSVHDPADHPLSLYAATKRANELMAHSYGHLWGLPTTGLRFFSVYGPWGRPDMAYFGFAEAILDGRPITVYGDGSALRDFTFVDDIVEGLVRIARTPPTASPTWDRDHPDPATSVVPWRLFNIGHGHQATVNDLISMLERLLRRPAERVQAPEQPGDVPITHADVTDLETIIGFRPCTELEAGMRAFVAWLLEWRGVRDG